MPQFESHCKAEIHQHHLSQRHARIKHLTSNKKRISLFANLDCFPTLLKEEWFS